MRDYNSILEFFRDEEYYRLYREGIAFSKQISVLRKYASKKIPGMLAKGYRVYNRLRRAYLDYENELGPQAA